MHSVHPFAVNVSLRVHVVAPGNGYPNGFYAVLFKSGEKLLCGFGIPPQGLVHIFAIFNVLVDLSVAVPVSLAYVQGISQIPAETHVLYKLH